LIIHIGTSNEGKFREMSKMLEPLGHDVVKENIPYPEIQAENLRMVVEYGIQWILDNDKKVWMDDPDHGFVIDDSGLFIKGLKDFPGVYSKFVFFSIGNSGVLKLMEGRDHRDAVFRTALMFCRNNRTYYFEGDCGGRIAKEERGTHGFGYDPIFIPDGSDSTFAEMETDMKNKFSHRGEALDNFIDFLKKIEKKEKCKE